MVITQVGPDPYPDKDQSGLHLALVHFLLRVHVIQITIQRTTCPFGPNQVSN